MRQPYEELEARWGEINGYSPEQVVTCSSGSAALHLALEAMQLPLGSECICPDYTMIACARAVSLAGLTPVFVDCDERLLMTTTDETRCNKSSAIMAVHVYGRRVDMNRIHYEAEPRGLFVIEDLAEAHGIKPDSATHAACWSYYRNKIVAGEEGGAVAFRDVEHAKYARSLRSLGFTDAHDFQHNPRGHNYRMSNLHARYILDDIDTMRNGNCLRNLDINLQCRREIEGWYDEFCPKQWLQPDRSVVWVYDVRIPGMTVEEQDRVVAHLRSLGIEARHGFKPMTSQAEYSQHKFGNGMRNARDTRNNEDVHPNAYKASREVVYLPVQPGVTTRDDCRRAMEELKGAVST